MRKLFTLLLVAFATNGFAQTFKFYYSNHPKFLKGSDTLSFPFTGGVDAPQFSSVDLNKDGRKDIFVFDRSTSRVLCFLADNGKYKHAPQFEMQFPYMRSWALMRDFNLDGKEDLWTNVIDDRRYTFDTTTELYSGSIRVFVQNPSATFGMKQVSNQLLDYGRYGPAYINHFPDIYPYSDSTARNIGANSTDIPSLEDMDGDGDIDLLTFVGGTDQSPTYYENFKVNNLGVKYAKDSTRFVYRDACWGGIFYSGRLPNGQSANIFDIHLAQNDMSSCGYRNYYKAAQKHLGATNLILDINNDGMKDHIYGDVSWNNLISLVNGKNLHPQHRDSIISQDTVFPRNTTRANFISFPAAYYVDVDMDNINDLLVTTNDPVGAKNTDNVWMYKNTGTQAAPVFDYKGKNFFMFNNTIDFGSRTVPVVADIDGDSKKDLVIATSGDYSLTQNAADKLIYYRNVGTNAFPVYQCVDSNFLNLTNETVEIHPTFGDLTGDGKIDMIVGAGNGKLNYYQNTTNGNNIAFSLVTENMGGIDVGNNSAPNLADLNKDGLLDLIIGNKAGTVQYYKNVGTITSPVFNSVPTIDSLGGILTNDQYISSAGVNIIEYDGYSTPQVCELDGDVSTMELVTGSLSGRVFIYTGVSDIPGAIFQKRDTLFSLAAQMPVYSLRMGQRSVPCAASLDNDNKLDLLIGNMGGGLNFYASIPTDVDTSITFGGFNDISRAQLKVYPNPTSSEINFDTYNIKEAMSYQVVDLLGRVLFNGKVNQFNATETINISMLTEGIYFLKLNGGTQSFVSRFLVAR